MFFHKDKLTVTGFAPADLLTFQAKDVFEAGIKIGQATHKVVVETLANRLKRNKKKALDLAMRDMEVIAEIAQAGTLTVKGVNYADRYLSAVKGFAEGAKISLPEAAFLQKEIEAGCQTFITKNAKGEIAFLHTEENGDDDTLIKGKYNYKLVRAKIGKRRVTFFLYPGVCMWGPAYGTDETTGFTQLMDELYIAEKYHGPLWSNFVNFIFFDCANLVGIQVLAKRLAKLATDFNFHGGYAIHMIQHGEHPKALSFEFGGNLIKKITTNYKEFSQANYPKNKEFRRMSQYDAQTYLEMTRREKRFRKIYNQQLWQVGNAPETINTGLKVLAYPYGDLRKYKNEGKWFYYHTAIPSIWTAAHFVGHISKKSTIHIGKLNADPIVGMEYNVGVDENYKYQERKLWETSKHTK